MNVDGLKFGLLLVACASCGDHLVGFGQLSSRDVLVLGSAQADVYGFGIGHR
jgi:hypothetical protein